MVAVDPIKSNLKGASTLSELKEQIGEAVISLLRRAAKALTLKRGERKVDTKELLKKLSTEETNSIKDADLILIETSSLIPNSLLEKKKVGKVTVKIPPAELIKKYFKPSDPTDNQVTSFATACCDALGIDDYSSQPMLKDNAGNKQLTNVLVQQLLLGTEQMKKRLDNLVEIAQYNLLKLGAFDSIFLIEKALSAYVHDKKPAVQMTTSSKSRARIDEETIRRFLVNLQLLKTAIDDNQEQQT